MALEKTLYKITDGSLIVLKLSGEIKRSPVMGQKNHIAPIITF